MPVTDSEIAEALRLCSGAVQVTWNEATATAPGHCHGCGCAITPHEFYRADGATAHGFFVVHRENEPIGSNVPMCHDCYNWLISTRGGSVSHTKDTDGRVWLWTLTIDGLARLQGRV